MNLILIPLSILLFIAIIARIKSSPLNFKEIEDLKNNNLENNRLITKEVFVWKKDFKGIECKKKLNKEINF